MMWKQFKLTFLSALFLIMMLYSSLSSAQSIEWQSWSSSVFDAAQKNNRQVLVIAEADWCHFCKQLESTTLQNAELAQFINKRFIPVRLNIDSNADFVTKYGLKELPTFIVFNANQQITKQFSGFYTAKNLINKLKGS